MDRNYTPAPGHYKVERIIGSQAQKFSFGYKTENIFLNEKFPGPADYDQGQMVET